VGDGVVVDLDGDGNVNLDDRPEEGSTSSPSTADHRPREICDEP